MSATPSAPASPRFSVHRGMRVNEIATLFPPAADIMAEYGLHCFSCSVGGIETLEEGCRMHGFDDETIDLLLSDIHDAIAKEPARPQTLTVTAAAARGIRDIAQKEGKENHGLRVMTDESGNFCMEFTENKEEDEQTFSAKEEPDVRVYASPFTLQRIGGATIDMREGRFKLDMEETAGCACGGKCSCGR